MLGSFMGYPHIGHDKEEEEAWTDGRSHNIEFNILPSDQAAEAALLSSSTPRAFNSSALHMRQLLINCAGLVSHSDFTAARRLLSLLSASSSPYGDSTERLVHQFVRGLSLRMAKQRQLPLHTTRMRATAIGRKVNDNNKNYNTTNNNDDDDDSSSSRPGRHKDIIIMDEDGQGAGEAEAEAAAFQSSYLSLNQITPYVRFSHLTANQAILEAVEGERAIHIIDFDIMLGVQWPPLMQAIAARSTALAMPPPMLRITGTGKDSDVLATTGQRLLKFAQSLGLQFQFHPLLLKNTSRSRNRNRNRNRTTNGDDDDDNIDDLLRLDRHLFSDHSTAPQPDEALVVNFVFYLHKHLEEEEEEEEEVEEEEEEVEEDFCCYNNGSNNNNNCRRRRHRQLLQVQLLLKKVKAMKPKVVTVAEREANHNQRAFMQRFTEALDHYTAIFDSLEATLPPSSEERVGVERIWFGREILDIVGVAEESRRRVRHQRFGWWEVTLRGLGFSNVPFSPFALSQAKLLLTLHYPSQGYLLRSLHPSSSSSSSLLLGWQNQPLFSVSAWRPN